MPDRDRAASAWKDMGWSLQQLGRYEEAAEAFRKALLLRPGFPLAGTRIQADRAVGLGITLRGVTLV